MAVGKDHPHAPSSTPPPSRFLIYTILFLVQLTFVIWSFIAKFAMAHVTLPPLVFAMYREAVASLMLSGCVLWTRREKNTSHKHAPSASSSSPSMKELQTYTTSFLILGVCMFINVVGYIVGLSMVSSFNAAILQPTQPIFASAVAWACGIESISTSKALSIAMATAGAVLTVWLGGHEAALSPEGNVEEDVNATPGSPQLGNLILLVQCMCSGAMWVVQKRVLSTLHSPMLVTAISYAIASFFTILATILTLGPTNPLLWVSSKLAWASILYAAVFATVFNYYAMSWANHWANASTVTLSLSLQPLLAAVGTAMGGGAALVPLQGVSCGLIVVGLVVKVRGEQMEQEGGIVKVGSSGDLHGSEGEGEEDEEEEGRPDGVVEMKPLISTRARHVV